MTTLNSLGIWMDHSTANVIEFTADPMETKIIKSKFTHEAKVESMEKGELLMHSKEQHQHLEFYKELSEIIRKFDQVILFGPTTAKSELHNLLKENHLFANIKIETKSADKMTDNQQHAFVREYFSRK